MCSSDLVDNYKKLAGEGNDPEAMKKLALAEAQKQGLNPMQAVNHFVGKEKELTSARDQMSKLKKKYANLKGLEDLTKRRPNEMRGKPWIERIVPGLTLQFLSGKNVVVDVNPSLTYLFNTRLSAGLGWVERLTVHDWQVERKNPVYGLRSFGEFKLSKGFAARADVESLNAMIPQPNPGAGPNDSGERIWGVNIFVGMKKDFKVFKNIRGNAQMLYRIWNEQYQTPYPDRFTVRMGFEFLMKKRKKK